jgi:hypothetical protein
MTSTVIHLIPSKRKRRFQVINDAIPGMIILYTGLETLMDHGFSHAILPYVSIAVGIMVIHSAIDELRNKKSRREINWFDISGGCVIIIEAVNRYNPQKGFQPAHLLIFAGIVTILRGVFAERFPKLRLVKLSEEGLFARTNPFRSISFQWSDLVRIDQSASALMFHLGQRALKLHLRQAGNREDVMEKILGAARARGIQVEEIA